MARPKKGNELSATRQIGVRVSEEIRKKLDANAIKNGRSITDEVRDAIALYLAKIDKRKA